jgi:hypothetical protein
MNGARRMTHEQELHVRAHIHQQGIGVFLQKLPGLFGVQGLDALGIHSNSPRGWAQL